MPRLSVNLNKIALLRNSRRTGVPDVLRFGRIVHRVADVVGEMNYAQRRSLELFLGLGERR